MIRLLHIEWLKLKHYRPFWILMGLTALITIGVCSSGMLFMEFLKKEGADFKGFDPTMLPLYDFPDIWQNITYVASFFKILPAFIVIISIANEFSHRILRQNIIDGLSKKEWLLSKILFMGIIAISFTIVVGLIGLVTGLIYAHLDSIQNMFSGTSFLLAYCLDVFIFLLFAMLLTLIVRRGGLVIVGLFMYTFMIEPFGVHFLNYYPHLPDGVRAMAPFLPIRAIHNLVPIPFPRYMFWEIQDYVSVKNLLVALCWGGFFIAASYWILKRKDL